MKGVVKIKNMRVYAFHGCLKEESKIGGDYLVNLRAYCNLAAAEALRLKMAMCMVVQMKWPATMMQRPIWMMEAVTI